MCRSLTNSVQSNLVEWYQWVTGNYQAQHHYGDVIMSAMACQITGLSTVCTNTDQRKHQLSATGLCEGNSPGPVNSPHKGPVTRKLFPFDGVRMLGCLPRTSLTTYMIRRGVSITQCTVKTKKNACTLWIEFLDYLEYTRYIYNITISSGFSLSKYEKGSSGFANICTGIRV